MYSKYTVVWVNCVTCTRNQKSRRSVLTENKNQIVDTLISLFSSCRIILVRGGGGGFFTAYGVLAINNQRDSAPMLVW